MKIKDVEKRTGITSYNIRFYEKENLLIPKRNQSCFILRIHINWGEPAISRRRVWSCN